MMKVFDEFFLFGTFDKQINASFISLISKCSLSICLNEYRLICLMGCIYKILAKILANRLQKVMEEVVGDDQFSFVRGKQILDYSG